MSRLLQWWACQTFSTVAAFYIGLFSVLFGLLIAPSVSPHRPAHIGQQQTHDHEHFLLEHSASPAPAIELSVEQDAMDGWNVLLRLKDFNFSPQTVNKDNQFNAGHAHLYVNGEKRSRLYAPYFHLTGLLKGKNTISVTLNANDHAMWTVGDEPIAATQTLTVN